MNYKQLYDKIIMDGEMPLAGLCFSADVYINGHARRKLNNLFNPQDGRKWWAQGIPGYAAYKFTPLRQNILLFMAAINNQL